jgi:hypothetical protein
MASWMRLDTRDVSGFDYDGLDATAYGVLMLLAWRSWEQGGIPDDPQVILRALRGRIDGPAFDAAWRQIRPLLDADTDGKLRFPWVEEARDEMLDNRKSETERKREWRLRERQARLSRGTPASVPQDSHVLPASVPAHVRTDVRTNEPPEAERALRAVVSKKPATGDCADLTRHFEAEWTRVRGGSYIHQGPKDGSAVAKLIGSLGLVEAKLRATAMLEDRDPWISANATLAVLHSKINKWAPRPTDDRLSGYRVIGGGK